MFQYCREVKNITQREEAQEILVVPAFISQANGIAQYLKADIIAAIIEDISEPNFQISTVKFYNRERRNWSILLKDLYI